MTDLIIFPDFGLIRLANIMFVSYSNKNNHKPIRHQQDTLDAGGQMKFYHSHDKLGCVNLKTMLLSGSRLRVPPAMIRTAD